MRYVDTAAAGAEAGLGAWLRPRLGTAELFAARTGFLTHPGLSELQPLIEDLLGRGGRIELVSGGEYEQADPDALIALLRMRRRFGDALDVRVVTGTEAFHNAKVAYVRHPGGRAEALVGSANITRGGLDTNHEAAVSLDSDLDETSTLDEVLAAVRLYQDEQRAVSLSGEVIAELHARRPAQTSRTRVTALGDSVSFEELLQPTFDLVDAAATTRETRGIPTGFTDLDEVTGGLYPGTLTVLGSRPSVGRTTLALDLCRAAAIKHKLGALFFTAAAPKQEIADKLMAAEARIRVGDMRGGRLTDHDWTRMARWVSALAEPPLYINAVSAPHLDALVDEITLVHAENGVRLVALDPMSAITANTEPGAGREREVAVIMRRLKAVALELDVAVVVTAELGRQIDQNVVRRPQLADLRESDTIAQVADNVILLHRPDAYERDDPRMGEVDLILAKHRLGPTATITVAHQLHYSRFVDMALE